MRNSKKQRKSLLLIILLLLVTIGYAVLTTNLKIFGFANIKGNTWDVHFENVRNHRGVTPDPAPVSDDATTTELVFGVDLDLPGDYYEFEVDAVNDGSIDAMVNLIVPEFYTVVDGEPGEDPVKTKLNEKPGYINYSVTYSDGGEIEDYHLLAHGQSVSYKVRVEYDINQVSSTNVKLECIVKPVFVQADERATGRLLSYDTGDVVYFDPVNYRICDDDKFGDTCYQWTVVGKNGRDYDLFYVEDDSNMRSTTSNPFNKLSELTSTWSSQLTVPEEYDLTDYNITLTKARLLTVEEYNTYSSQITSVGSCISYPCMGVNTTAGTLAGLINGGTHNLAPLLYINSGNSTNYYIHPVIHINMRNVGSNTIPLQKIYYMGDLVYFDPVSSSPCNKDTFNLSAVTSGQSTCYKWRVAQVSDSASNQNLNLQLDHNIIRYIPWNTGEGVKSYNGPVNALNSLAYATSSWTRVPLLNYTYDTTYNDTNTGYNYGVMTCTNGTCTATCRNGDSKCSVNGTLVTGLRARMITGEELREMVMAVGAAEGSGADLWTPATDDYFYFSRTDGVIGTSTWQSSGGSIKLRWLIENTYQGDYAKGTNNVYGDNTNGYWTLTAKSVDSSSVQNPEYMGKDIWFITCSGTFSFASLTNTDTAGIRPFITIPKSLLN